MKCFYILCALLGLSSFGVSQTDTDHIMNSTLSEDLVGNTLRSRNGRKNNNSKKNKKNNHGRKHKHHPAPAPVAPTPAPVAPAPVAPTPAPVAVGVCDPSFEVTLDWDVSDGLLKLNIVEPQGGWSRSDFVEVGEVGNMVVDNVNGLIVYTLYSGLTGTDMIGSYDIRVEAGLGTVSTMSTGYSLYITGDAPDELMGGVTSSSEISDRFTGVVSTYVDDGSCSNPAPP